jgi:hypothetical protein
VLIVALSGCATDFSPNYTLDFAGYPAPVLLNAQSEELLADESRRLSESVSRSATASSMTAFGTSTSTAGGVTTNSSWSVTSTSEYSTIDESTPIGMKLYVRTHGKEIPLALSDIKLLDLSFFLFGGAVFMTDFSVSATMLGGEP